MEMDPYDVIVTDMRMPGMDGEQLLATVRDRFPSTVRIILSGDSEQEAVVRAIGPAHRYLSKPCDGITLRQAVAGACRVQELLESEAVRRVVTRIDQLPVLSAHAERLLHMFRDWRRCRRSGG